MKSRKGKAHSVPKPNRQPKLSRSQTPSHLPPQEWQSGLRRQFGRKLEFGLENLGSEPFFSEFRMT